MQLYVYVTNRSYAFSSNFVTRFPFILPGSFRVSQDCATPFGGGQPVEFSRRALLFGNTTLTPPTIKKNTRDAPFAWGKYSYRRILLLPPQRTPTTWYRPNVYWRWPETAFAGAHSFFEINVLYLLSQRRWSCSGFMARTSIYPYVCTRYSSQPIFIVF